MNSRLDFFYFLQKVARQSKEHNFSDIPSWSYEEIVGSGSVVSWFPVQGVHVRVIRVGRIEHPVAVLAAVGHRIPQMLRLDVILQGGQACAGLVEPTHLALVAALAKLLNSLPDQCSGILCNMGLVRFRILSQWQRCSYGALICARSDCFSIGNVCHRTGKRTWTGCRGGRHECDPPSRSSTRTTWSRCDIARRLLYCARHPPLGSYTGCSLLKWHQQ